MKTLPIITCMLLLLFTFGLQAQTVTQTVKKNIGTHVAEQMVVEPISILNSQKELKSEKTDGQVREHFIRVIANHEQEKTTSVQPLCQIVPVTEQKGDSYEE